MKKIFLALLLSLGLTFSPVASVVWATNSLSSMIVNVSLPGPASGGNYGPMLCFPIVGFATSPISLEGQCAGGTGFGRVPSGTYTTVSFTINPAPLTGQNVEVVFNNGTTAGGGQYCQIGPGDTTCSTSYSSFTTSDGDQVAVGIRLYSSGTDPFPIYNLTWTVN